MENQEQRFKLFTVLRAHLLPLTNCAFNKAGDKFITGSYDRTCRVWDTESGKELLSLEEHKNVVYTMAFNNPFGNLIMTSSFDKTAKIWNPANGRPGGLQKTLLCDSVLTGRPKPRANLERICGPFQRSVFVVCWIPKPPCRVSYVSKAVAEQYMLVRRYMLVY